MQELGLYKTNKCSIIFRMSALIERDNRIDVICQHTRSAKIIPIRIRITDEDGEIQNYSIQSYKDISRPGEYQLPNMVRVERFDYIFECRILVFGNLKTIKIMYNCRENLWRIL